MWVPRLAYGAGVAGFFVGHRGHQYASTTLMDPMTMAFVAEVHGFVAARGLELVAFAKGQRKDDLAQELLANFSEPEGVLFVGRAQEKAQVWRTQRRHNPVTEGSYAWLVRASALARPDTQQRQRRSTNNREVPFAAQSPSLVRTIVPC